MTGTKRRVLIAGGRGMVGRNLREHPGMAAFDVYAPPRSELDLCDWSATLAYMDRVQPDIVVHAAGHVGGIKANMSAPVQFLTANTDMARNVIMAARQVEVPELLNLGSSCIYPRMAPNPIQESQILMGELEPTNEAYAIAKIFALRLCAYIRRETPQFAYKTLVPCNQFGRYDNFDPEHSHLLPGIILKIHQAKQSGAESVEIWGDGTSRREFMYAGDLADALVTAISNFAAVPDLMNIGLGVDYSITEYYQTVADVLGWTGSFRYDLGRPTGMKQKLVDIQQQQAWGWSPKTSLRDGIARAYDYYLGEIAK